MKPMRDAVQGLVAWILVCSAGLALAQTALDSPISGVPLGQGAGVHGANSPYAPLAERSDVPAVTIDTERGIDFFEQPSAPSPQPVARVFGGGRPNQVRTMPPANGRVAISAAAAQSTTVVEFGKARQITQRAG